MKRLKNEATLKNQPRSKWLCCSKPLMYQALNFQPKRTPCHSKSRHVPTHSSDSTPGPHKMSILFKSDHYAYNMIQEFHLKFQEERKIPSFSMPSPVIPRAKSAPDINSPQSPSDLQATSKSIRPTRSTGSPVITWPKKIEEYIKGKTKNPDLTEERLQEFNRRNVLLEARYNTSSPYYKGLTDFSLDINREKHSCSSPGRESHATSYVTAGSISSFAIRVQEWGSSCFTSRKYERSSSSHLTKSSRDTRLTSSSSPSVKITKIKTKTAKNHDSESERKKVTFHAITSADNTVTLSTMEKPLRERDSEPPLVMLPVPLPTASPPESLPYPPPQITPPTAQWFLPPSPPPAAALQAPSPQTPAGGGEISENKEIKMTETEKKYIWADRYRPYWLQQFLCNRTTALWLKSIVQNWHDTDKECGHFIFVGNPGVGKRTMIWALLREAFGPDNIQARQGSKKFYLKGEATSSITVNAMVSPRHVEINLSELKGYEKHVLVELIKDKSQIVPDSSMQCNQQNCKAIILYEAEKLSTDALLYIKWMLEKFKGCNKVFFCCSDAKKLQAIKPLCTYVQLLEPSIEEILEVLTFIAKEEGIHLPPQLANEIAKNSKNNLRQAIRSFEATWHFSGCSASLREDQGIKNGWEDKIANIARNVLAEQSPKQLYNIRGELQNLIEHNVAPDFIFQTLKEELKKILPEHLQPQFHHLYDEYQKNHANKKYFSSAYQEEELGKRKNDQRQNVQQFMRIEEFIARFMSWYKGLTTKNKEILPDQIQVGQLAGLDTIIQS